MKRVFISAIFLAGLLLASCESSKVEEPKVNEFEISSYSYDDNNGIIPEIKNGKIAWTGQPIISELISWDQQKGTYDEVIANTTVETSIQNIDNKGYWFYTININNSRQDQDFQIGNIGNTFVFIC